MGDTVTLPSQSELESLNIWLDQFNLSRFKKNISKDFADGVLISEILQHYFPKLVEVHNYNPANGVAQKKSNWETLNRKVLSKLNVQLTKTDLEQIVKGKCGVIENFLLKIKRVIESYEREKSAVKIIDLSGDSVDTRNANDLQYQLHNEASLPSFVPSVLLADKEKEILFQRETIKMLQARISRLEELLILKETQLNEMNDQVKRTSDEKKINYLV